MPDATPPPQPPAAMRPQTIARWNPTRGVWETSQTDLFGRWTPYVETWPTSGYLHEGSAYRRPTSAHPTTGSASSSSPTALFRTPLAPDSSRGGESLEQVRARKGTIALSHQIIDLALHGPAGSPRQSPEPETPWSLIEDIVAAGGRYAHAIARREHITGREAPSPALVKEGTGPRPAPDFVEWPMGLDAGWVVDPRHDLTAHQQLTALGNGVLPLQAAAAIERGCLEIAW